MRSRSSPPGRTRCSARPSWRSPRIIRWRPPWRGEPRARRLRRRVPARRHQRGRDRDPGEARLRHRPALPPPVRPGRLLPVYVANFVLMDYGTGAIFGCPAHDQRDLDFARKYGLPVLPVVCRRMRPAGDLRGRRRGLYRRRHGCSTRASSTASTSRRPSAGDRGAGAPGWARRDHLAPARLGRLAPALLGLPDPGDPLRRLRHRAGARATRSAGRAARGRRLLASRATRSTATRPGSTSTARAAAAGAARDRHLRHLRRELLVFRALLLRRAEDALRPRRGRLLAAGRPVYRRRRARGPAPALLALLHPRHARVRLSRSTSRSPACSRKA